MTRPFTSVSVPSVVSIGRMRLAFVAASAWVAVLGAPLDALAQAAEPAGASQALLGIRPEDLEPVPAGTGDALACRVVVVETLGAQQLVTLEWQGQSLKALLEPDVAMRQGDGVWMRPKPHRIRWMEATTGEAMR